MEWVKVLHLQQVMLVVAVVNKHPFDNYIEYKLSCNQDGNYNRIINLLNIIESDNLHNHEFIEDIKKFRKSINKNLL
jgi:uncharacterized membrane protein YukC